MYLGIDFGTSFSKIATMYLEQPLLLLNPGEYGIPSEFYYDRESGVLIGQDALDAGQGEAAKNLVSEVKMDVLSGKTYTLDGRTFTAKEIIKEIYKTLIKKAVQIARKRSLNTEIEGVVISVPAKFGIQERYLISEAARECLDNETLPLKAIIKEPVAAALSYYNTSLKDGTNILVYDLGAGTCDVALLLSDGNAFEHYTVVDADMVRIGGRMWDQELIRHITQLLETQSGIAVRGNAGYEEKIRRAAISVKHDLSDPMKKRAFARVELNGRIYSIPITRAEFDELTMHLLQKTFECLQGVYDKNKASCQIDEIICVGGSSNMLQVEEGLLKQFPQCRIRIYEPEHAVVNGVAVFADSKVKVKEFAGFSYGIECWHDYEKNQNDKIISNIIMKGSTLPTENTRHYRPVSDDQTSLRYAVYESESAAKEFDFREPDKRYVGEIVLQLSPNAKKTLDTACTIRLSENGLLEVKASEPSGKEVQASFQIRNL